jgi:hypothetical protein
MTKINDTIPVLPERAGLPTDSGQTHLISVQRNGGVYLLETG